MVAARRGNLLGLLLACVWLGLACTPAAEGPDAKPRGPTADDPDAKPRAVVPEDVGMKLHISRETVLEYEIPDIVIEVTNKGKAEVLLASMGPGATVGLCRIKNGKIADAISPVLRDMFFQGPYRLLPGHSLCWRVWPYRLSGLMAAATGEKKVILKAVVAKYTGKEIVPVFSNPLTVTVKELSKEERASFETLCERLGLKADWEAFSRSHQADPSGLRKAPWGLVKAAYVRSALLKEAAWRKKDVSTRGRSVRRYATTLRTLLENQKTPEFKALGAVIAPNGPEKLADMTDEGLLQAFDKRITLRDLAVRLGSACALTDTKLAEGAFASLVRGVPIFVDGDGRRLDTDQVEIPRGYAQVYAPLIAGFRRRYRAYEHPEAPETTAKGDKRDGE